MIVGDKHADDRKDHKVSFFQSLIALTDRREFPDAGTAVARSPIVVDDRRCPVPLCQEGLVVMYGLLARKAQSGLTALFLLTTVATSATGFGFPVPHIMPSHIVGAISLLVLLIAILARYLFRLRGAWRWIYVVTAMIALYLNVFVLIVQAFQKLPLLRTLAPTQSEPPFKMTQLVVLILFVLITIIAALRFRIAPKVAARPVTDG